MQKLALRSTRVARVAARKKARTDEHLAKAESWERSQTRNQLVRLQAERTREIRRNQKQDWEAGSLAPRRDVGENAATYGAISIYNMNLPDKDPANRPKWFHIVEGDRALVTHGRDKGKIGVVNNVNKEKVAAQLKDIGEVDVILPEWMTAEDKHDSTMQAFARSIPLEYLRLVYPLPDPETGVPRDVVVDRLYCVGRNYDKVTKEWDNGNRVISGTDTIIPWPELDEPVPETHDDDTTASAVSEITFQPPLIYAPFPVSIIDELRNKYSKFRTRHEPEYIEQKELEFEKIDKRKELINTVRTPLRELQDVRRAQKEAAQTELTDEQLAKIGEVMAAEMAKAEGAVRQLKEQ